MCIQLAIRAIVCISGLWNMPKLIILCSPEIRFKPVLCMYFGFCVCVCSTIRYVLIVLQLHYFSHCPAPIAVWAPLIPVDKSRVLFVSHLSQVVYVVTNFKIWKPKVCCNVTNRWHFLTIKSSDIIQIRLGSLVTKLHTVLASFATTLMHSSIQWIMQTSNDFFSHSNYQPFHSFLSQPQYSVLQSS
jgi:hypothetical protein